MKLLVLISRMILFINDTTFRFYNTWIGCSVPDSSRDFIVGATCPAKNTPFVLDDGCYNYIYLEAEMAHFLL